MLYLRTISDDLRFMFVAIMGADVSEDVWLHFGQCFCFDLFSVDFSTQMPMPELASASTLVPPLVGPAVRPQASHSY